MSSEGGAITARKLSREEQVERLRNDEFDLAVIGAGINGAAVARDAAMRGLKVALFDKGDFAGATSSRSSKLIHGGFRYLPQGHLRLVYTALRERERLRRLTAPHLVRPIRFLMPLYRGHGYSRFAVGAGLALYDLFARMPAAERHRTLDSASVRAAEPMLIGVGLRGGAVYYDAGGDDARLTLENALDAAYHGAAVANYIALDGFARIGGRIRAGAVRDLVGGRDGFELRARAFVNATGPWVDALRRMDDPGAARSVRLTKGVHLVIARASLPVREALVLSDGQERIVFVMPHGSYVLVGTTDTDFAGDPGKVRANRADIAYLLEVLRESLRDANVGESQVAATFAGLRALALKRGAIAPSSVGREEIIVESPSGLLTVAGGKLTTHRWIAAKIVERVMVELGRPSGVCPTLDTPLPGARALSDGNDGDALGAMAAGTREMLEARYGTHAAMVAQVAVDGDAALAQPLAPGCPAIGAEVIHTVRAEMACSLVDFMVRRLGRRRWQPG
jgi:glycerol-3-phosphate dehydrogenase